MFPAVPVSARVRDPWLEVKVVVVVVLMVVVAVVGLQVVLLIVHGMVRTLRPRGVWWRGGEPGRVRQEVLVEDRDLEDLLRTSLILTGQIRPCCVSLVSASQKLLTCLTNLSV